MAKTKDDSFCELFDKAVGAAQEVNSKDKANDNLMVKQAKVIGYDGDTYKTFVYFIDDLNQTSYTLYNKTGENLSEGDTVKVYYTSNPAKGWIGLRCGEPDIPVDEKPMYISAKVANSQLINYDSIERGILSVDFTVDGTDSDVVFAGNQLCDTTVAGTLKCTYKVDGATQDFKPAQLLTAGKHIVPHIYPMPLNTGKHNFSVFVNSPDGGKGATGISEFVGALSGQISGLKNNVPPNENLIFYLANVPENTEIGLPSYMYSFNSSAKKYVDWGDNSPVEESDSNTAVTHTYTNAGSYTVTIKCNDTNFQNTGNVVLASDNFSKYITRIYFPDNAIKIGWGRSSWNYFSATRNFGNLETLVFGNSAIEINWDFHNSPKITSLLIPESVQRLRFDEFNKANVSSFIIPKNVTDYNNNSGATIWNCTSLTNLEIYGTVSLKVRDCPNLRRLIVSKNATVEVQDCPSIEDYEIV